MAPFQLRWIVQKNEEGQVLREFLYAKEISRRTLTAIKFEGGKIEVNRKEVNVRYILKENDLVSIQFPAEVPSESLTKDPVPLDIVYEDESVLVVNKPPGILTIPSREQPTHAIANGLLNYYQEKQIESAVHIVTRLDRDTSGLLLVAKHRYIHYLLTLQQKVKTLKRKYEALAEGVLKQANQTIIAPIGRKEDSIIERKVTEDGQYAETEISLIRQYQDFAHTAVKLRTGRTHQIRVHLSYIGHPLVGDDLYGGSLKWMKRQALHCVELSFIHPVTGEVKTFHSELPADIKTLLNQNKR
ncbi:RluA family pseudouridine synthase [Bacillus oleivorans]|uniref:Pseudouridine synthase n=1 Tax=Bacillus oleivorans TaxID=1448271 RepID=A0A285D301_9BACI|nr:RluA family pseudouridine synthase [Bacillus oleivorans]SNX74162.1 RluA family pseudouridine synthase [Bacillus oleivorans]